MRPENMLKINDYSTIYVDMDSFFASVEQFYQPSLRGKPVGVATGTTSGASIIAASYEAKRAGIRTGTKVESALQMCPSLQIVYDSPNSYRHVHREFMAILRGTICHVQARGIDEAYLKVPSYAQNKHSIYALIKAINTELYNLYNEHINCSIGIAPNIWLAKMAASYKKPKGQFTLTQPELTNFYMNFNLHDLTGIGSGMARQFRQNNILTPLALYNTPYQVLSRRFGVVGQKWYLRMRGFEVDHTYMKPQLSISHQVTICNQEISSIDKITTYCIKIGETLSKRLISKELFAKNIHLQLLFEDYTKFENKIQNCNNFQSSNIISIYIKTLLKKHKLFKNIKRICITLYGLSSKFQLNLFEPCIVDTPITKVKVLSQKYENNEVTSVNNYFDSTINLSRIGFAGDIVRETSETIAS